MSSFFAHRISRGHLLNDWLLAAMRGKLHYWCHPNHLAKLRYRWASDGTCILIILQVHLWIICGKLGQYRMYPHKVLKGLYSRQPHCPRWERNIILTFFKLCNIASAFFLNQTNIVLKNKMSMCKFGDAQIRG